MKLRIFFHLLSKMWIMCLFAIALLVVALAYPAYADKTSRTTAEAQVKVVLEKTPIFVPKGGREDNTVNITAKIIGGKKGSFKFSLYDVSNEPGFCMNAPLILPATGEDSSSWKDLQFITQAGFTITGTNQDVAQTTASNLTQASVYVQSFDYGAYGKIKVEVTLEGSTTPLVGVEDGSTRKFVDIPLDANGNHISDFAPSQDIGPGTTFDAADDDDATPVGKSTNGDWLTRYEEYRGFMQGPQATSGTPTHIRTFPSKKDVFIYDRDKLSVGYFTLLGFELHPYMKRTQMDIASRINFNNSTAHAHDMTAINLLKSPPGVSGGSTFGTVNTGAVCSIGRDSLLASGGTQAHIDSMIAHELGHAVYLSPPSGGGHGHRPQKGCIMDSNIYPTLPAETTYCTTVVGTDAYICVQEYRMH